MSHRAPYQWLCLRAIEARQPHRRPTTPSPRTPKRHISTTDIPPTSTPSPEPEPSSPTEETLDAFLHSANDHELSETLRHLATLTNTIAQTTSFLLSTTRASQTISSSAPPIPPYTIAPHRRHLDLIPRHVAPLDAATKRVRDNLTDLLSIPYPDKNTHATPPSPPASITPSFKDANRTSPKTNTTTTTTTKTTTTDDEPPTLTTLKYRRAAQEVRTNLAVAKLEAHVKQIEAVKMAAARRESPFARVVTSGSGMGSGEGSVGGARVAAAAGEDGVDFRGWGSAMTGRAEGGSAGMRKGNPFAGGASTIKNEGMGTNAGKKGQGRSGGGSLLDMQKQLDASIQAGR